MKRQPKVVPFQQSMQVIHDEQGVPIFVVLPYKEYMEQSLNHLPDAVREDVLAGSTRIRAWRNFLGLTQEEVAVRLGISQSSYTQYERNRRLGSLTRRRIAKVLGLSDGDL
jgi:DNA-binding XRE family transcriptional regulator